MLPNNPQVSTQSNKLDLKPWLLASLLIFAALLRLFVLEQDSLWNDELSQVLVAHGSFAQSLTNMTKLTASAPIDYLITYFVLHYVGQSEIALRLPAVIWGVLAVLMTYKLGAYLFDKRVAFLAAFLLTIVPLHIQYSREARFYSLPTFLILLVVFTFVRATDKNTRLTWVLYGAALTFALYSHFYAILVAGMLAFWLIPAWCVFKRYSLSVVKGFVVSSGVAFLVFMPWFGYFNANNPPGKPVYNYPTISEVLVGPFVDVSLGGSVLDPQASLDTIRQKFFDYWGVIRWTVGIYWSLVLAGVVLVVRHSAPRSFRSHLSLLLLLFLGGIASAFLIDYMTRYYFAARQFVFYTPFALLTASATMLFLVGSVGSQVNNRSRRSGLLGGAVIMMALVSLWIWWQPLTDNYKPSKQDWRGTSRYLLRNVRRDDVLLTPFSDFIGFYSPEVLAQAPAQFPEDRPAMANLAQSHHRIWIVLVHSPLYSRPPVLSQWIAVNHLLPLMFGRDLEIYSYSSEDTF